MKQVTLKIGERLKEIRNKRQLTLEDVAELTGVSKPMLGQIERGQMRGGRSGRYWKRMTGILNTYSNPDHIGGNKYLQGQTGCKIFSSGIEAAFTRYPVLEPSFLYGSGLHQQQGDADKYAVLFIYDVGAYLETLDMVEGWKPLFLFPPMRKYLLM